MPLRVVVDGDDDRAKVYFVPSHSRRGGAIHAWRPRASSSSSSSKRSKRSAGGDSGCKNSWRWLACLSCWPSARVVCTALLAAWIVVMHALHPLWSRRIVIGPSDGVVAAPHLVDDDGPPGICARIAASDLGGGAHSSSSRHRLAASLPGRWRPVPRAFGHPDQPCSNATSVLVVLLVQGDADDGAATACARARAAADDLQKQQTLACFEIALLGLAAARTPNHGRNDTQSPEQPLQCPGIRAFGGENGSPAAETLSRHDFVVFWGVNPNDDHHHQHHHRMQSAALEKLVLAAYGVEADVVSIEADGVGEQGAQHDDDINQTCIARRRPPRPGSTHQRPRRSNICRSAGAPVLLRVPTWLPEKAQVEVWAGAVVDAMTMTMMLPMRSSSEEALAALFCVGQEDNMTAHSLREEQLMMMAMLGNDQHHHHHHHHHHLRGRMMSPSEGERRSRNDDADTNHRRRWCERLRGMAADEQQQQWSVIADAYIARAYSAANATSAAEEEATLPDPDLRTRDHDFPTASLLRPNPTDTPSQIPGFLLIVPWLEHGGADQFNVNLARELTRSGVRVVVVTTLSSHNPTSQDFYAVTRDVFHLPHLVTSPKETGRVLNVLTYLIAARNVEVVMVSHSALGYRLLPSLREAMRSLDFGIKPKLVDFVHLEEMEWGGGGYAAMSVAYAQHLDHTFAASEHVKAWMESRRRQEDQDETRRRPTTTVAYIGVDTRLLTPLTPRARLVARHELFGSQAVTATTPIIAYLARMVDQKLPELYFEIVRQLREEKKVEFFASVAIGGGPRLEELRANLSSHLRSNLDQSESDQRQHKPPHLALGMLDHDAAVRVLAASDILLLPSRNEGIALAVYEAMALGVTPVVSAVGGQCELVSGGAGACLKVGVVEEEGMAVQKDAATPFVDELESLLRSPELLNKRKREARRRVEHEFTMRETMRALSRGLGCGVG